MGLSLCYGQNLSLEQNLKLILPFNKMGEIELFSLHRIKNRIKDLDVHSLTRRFLINSLMQENLDYRTINNNNRYCLTLDHVDSATSKTIEYLQAESQKGLVGVVKTPLYNLINGYFVEQVNKQGLKIRGWFSDNSDSLRYDTNSNIPYPVVMKIQESLKRWSVGEGGLFQDSVSDVLEELLTNRGVNPEIFSSDQEMWDALKRFNK